MRLIKTHSAVVARSAAPHHLGGNVNGLAGLPWSADAVGQVNNLGRLTLHALAMEGRRGDAAAALVRLAIGGDKTFAEQDLHALLGAVFAERCGFVDEHFADVGRVVEQHYITKQDAVMGGTAVAAQVLEEQNRITGLEELVEEIERQIHAQAGWVNVAAAAHQPWSLGIGGPIELVIRTSHGSSLDHRNCGARTPARFKLDGILWGQEGICT